MCLFIETLRLLNGNIRNLPFHKDRIARTLRHHFSTTELKDFDEALRASIKNSPNDQICKCRITYSTQIEKIEIEPYTIKFQGQIKVVEVSDLLYSFKYADRSIINAFQNAELNYTDILFAKHEFITDTSYANIVFSKSGRLFTPSRPLLQGTMRQSLLRQRKIQPREIKITDIGNYDTFQLINAMMNLDESPVYTVDIIKV